MVDLVASAQDRAGSSLMALPRSQQKPRVRSRKELAMTSQSITGKRVGFRARRMTIEFRDNEPTILTIKPKTAALCYNQILVPRDPSFDFFDQTRLADSTLKWDFKSMVGNTLNDAGEVTSYIQGPVASGNCQ